MNHSYMYSCRLVCLTYNWGGCHEVLAIAGVKDYYIYIYIIYSPLINIIIIIHMHMFTFNITYS